MPKTFRMEKNLDGKVKQLTEEAIEAVKPFGKKAEKLIHLANELLERKK